MLKKLIKEIQTNGASDTRILANRLGVSEAMIVAMLDTLKDMGLLYEVENCAEDHCEGCSAASLCSGGDSGKGRLWSVR